MPFSALYADSPQFHVTECANSTSKPNTECTEGLSCCSVMPSHYRRFKHSELARHRSGMTSSIAKKFSNQTVGCNLLAKHMGQIRTSTVISDMPEKYPLVVR
ncbi:hypothetical protein LSH36_189g05009 [Paralvinella palmiformis]|uniref:Uncharacterized protein n=1 Tax=Paralvinella palmiformis TaxID=53620 RepID=A0AAD9JRC9_9ANNE|nr:hypothetical protein LSH36_189g05009 [Paralvinella palmiformis]